MAESRIFKEKPEEKDGVLTISLCEDIDIATASCLKEAIDYYIDGLSKRSVEGHDCPWIIVDLSDVAYIDSSGLVVLIGGLKRAMRHKGSLRLVRPDCLAYRAFEIAGISQIFSWFNSVEEAKNAPW